MAAPVLWHIEISHYSEKVRWALDWKDVRYVPRAPQPGLHMLVALGLTRGRHKTFPILDLDGERIGDSTAIIAELERRFPDPPLYPEAGEQRGRALQLEEWFDEELGPYVRRLVFHELSRDRQRLEEMASDRLLGGLSRVKRVGTAGARSFVYLRYGARAEKAAEEARGKIVAALDRLERELGDGEYLAGERFTVADLTAATLFYPLVLPPEGPQIGDPPQAIERFRAPLAQRPGYRWVQDMFRRHRHPAAVSAPA